MLIEEQENPVQEHEHQMAKYSEMGYQYHYDIFFMKNFYVFFNFMKLSKFIDSVRFLCKAS